MSNEKPKRKRRKSKREQLKEALKRTLTLVLDCYPEIKGMLKKDLTVDQMASDIMTSLEEFTPEKMKEIKSGRAILGKKLKKLAKKLKI